MGTGKGSEWERMLANASFFGVLIIIGLPLWWKTTEVYRVALPYAKINSFDALQHTVTAEVTVLASDDDTAEDIIQTIKSTFNETDVLQLKITKAIMSDQLHHILNSVADEQDALEELAENLDLKRPNTLYVVQRKPLFQDVWVAKERVVFFRDNKASSILSQVLQQWIYQTSVLEGAKAIQADESRRIRYPPGNYHIVLSVVHPDPGVLKIDFDAGKTMEDYIGSFVDELSLLHNFTLSSQWLYYLDYDFQAVEKKDSNEWGRHFAIKQDRLHSLLTKLEARAATHISTLPTINLMLYVVKCNMAPLVIYHKNGQPVQSPVQGFTSPKWGGVVFDNPSKAACEDEAVWRPPVKLLMGTFIAQLRELIGIVDMTPITGAHLEPLRSVVPREWERDNLLRIRTLEQVSSAERTLQSLSKLLGEISNIVINDDVGSSINFAVESIQQVDKLLAQGDLLGAHNVSLHAYLAAETAFYDPSLLSLLYFPDDQKYAIYIPLFLPVMFPVILSLKSLINWLRGKKEEKRKQD